MNWSVQPAIVAAFLGVLTAAISTWVAWQQHKATRSKLRLDLYDRRYPVYGAANALLSAIITSGDLELQALFEFDRDTAQAEFLFDRIVIEYLEGLRSRALIFRQNRARLQSIAAIPEQSRGANTEVDAQHLEWFLAQLRANRDPFRRYLSFESTR